MNGTLDDVSAAKRIFDTRRPLLIDPSDGRDSMLKLLSDDEAARVITVETAVRLSVGDEYVDLEQLARGVQCASNGTVVMGRRRGFQIRPDETDKSIVAAPLQRIHHKHPKGSGGPKEHPSFRMPSVPGCTVPSTWCTFSGGHEQSSEEPSAIWKFFSQF